MDDSNSFWDELFERIKVETPHINYEEQNISNWKKTKIHPIKNSLILSNDEDNPDVYIYILPYGKMVMNNERVDYFYVLTDDIALNDMDNINITILNANEIKRKYSVDVNINDFNYAQNISDMVVDKFDELYKMRKLIGNDDKFKKMVELYIQDI